MTGALNGLGSGQQTPLANTFQPGQNTIRPDQSKTQQDNVVKARSADAAGTQRIETGNQSPTRGLQSLSDSDDSRSQRRGSLVDITV